MKKSLIIGSVAVIGAIALAFLLAEPEEEVPHNQVTS